MKYGIKQLRKDFPTDQACLEFAFDVLHSRECSCGGEYRPVKGRKQFYCTKCHWQIAPLANTIFERSLVPLTKWFEAILMVEHGASIREIQFAIGAGYKTAWRVKMVLRLAMKGSYHLKSKKLFAHLLRVRTSPVKTERKVAVVA
jgi:hypothetical protein